jgi:hypothetical protein
MRLLLQKEADIEAKGSYGKTAMFTATENEHETVVRLLLEREQMSTQRMMMEGRRCTKWP